ncbi:MAG: DNA mismatch repair endonuclease MutL, partial [Chloroflexi bacterium]|nr:DNA mismatch repair endonuclease MutL [Chloroflexota bacterium]
RIQFLPDSLTIQIAAGEVVERPAAVVKELFENSLDAAATRIDVVIGNGGRTEIRVADDGSGMSREDALLSLDRHATSKIGSFEDLRAIRSFGFRGEALPSIASVSRLTLETAEGGDVGTRVRVNAGRIQGVEDCARQRGTTVTVRNLFVNVPARAKFLRSAAVETRGVTDVVIALALSNLTTGFSLTSNGRTLLELPPAPDLVTRVAALWGDDVATRLIAIGHEAGAVSLAGLVERPDASLTGPRRVHLFVGGRPFRDRELVWAAERAYRTTVAAGARPSLLLYLQVGAGEVDVNVHPSKAEVRFRDRAQIEQAVEAAIHQALGRAESAATLDRRPTPPQLLRTPPRPPAGRACGLNQQLAFFVPAAEPLPVGTGAGSEPVQPADAAGSEGTAAPPLPATRPSLWQIHDSYILVETRSGLLIIDQHSAHERVLFEDLMRAFDSGSLPSQRLLFPLTLRLAPAEYTAVEANRDLLEHAGFEIEPFGGRTVIVHAAPTPHPWFDAERCLREVLTDLATGSELTRAAHNQFERLAMTLACKAAVKAGQPLGTAEMELLFERLFATELPYHDVHGRPTVIRLSLQELERRFGRHG